MKGWRYLLMIFVFVSSAMAYAANDIPVYTEDQKNITVTKKQPEFILKLKSNPSTGYSWALQQYDSKWITSKKRYYQASTSMLAGAGGFEWWTFRVKPAGFSAKKPMSILMIYRRPWEMNEGVKQVNFVIN